MSTIHTTAGGDLLRHLADAVDCLPVALNPDNISYTGLGLHVFTDRSVPVEGLLPLLDTLTDPKTTATTLDGFVSVDVTGTTPTGHLVRVTMVNADTKGLGPAPGLNDQTAPVPLTAADLASTRSGDQAAGRG
ncbi:hypothetical protein [Actinosynnema sp. NPDC023587]|uniref:hypothetical protein n=1 Tax=Actinosynnema sp. NPDC023587 TaxID=3154695 RepID=UPI0033C7C5F3